MLEKQAHELHQKVVQPVIQLGCFWRITIRVPFIALFELDLLLHVCRPPSYQRDVSGVLGYWMCSLPGRGKFERLFENQWIGVRGICNIVQWWWQGTLSHKITTPSWGCHLCSLQADIQSVDSVSTVAQEYVNSHLAWGQWKHLRSVVIKVIENIVATLFPNSLLKGMATFGMTLEMQVLFFFVCFLIFIDRESTEPQLLAGYPLGPQMIGGFSLLWFHPVPCRTLTAWWHVISCSIHLQFKSS